MPEFTLPKGARARALKLATEILTSLDEMVSWKVTVEPLKNARSAAQNAYLHGVCYKMISEATGYEVVEIHEYLLGLHFGWKEIRVPKKPSNPSGIDSQPIRTTTTDASGKRSVMTPMEFSDYVSFIQRFAAQKIHVLIPDPDPLYQLHRERAA